MLPGNKVREVKCSTGGKAYRKLVIRNTTVRRWVFVHELMLYVYRGERPIGMECRHLDGNPLNNHIDNLAWGTRLENAADRKKHNTQVHGSSHGRSKLNEREVEMILNLSKYHTQQELADVFGVSRSRISYIINGVHWKSVYNKVKGISNATTSTT